MAFKYSGGRQVPYLFEYMASRLNKKCSFQEIENITVESDVEGNISVSDRNVEKCGIERTISHVPEITVYEYEEERGHDTCDEAETIEVGVNITLPEITALGRRPF